MPEREKGGDQPRLSTHSPVDEILGAGLWLRLKAASRGAIAARRRHRGAPPRRRPRSIVALAGVADDRLTLDDAADLLVDHLGGGVGDVLALRHRVAKEDLLLVLAVA